MHATGFLYDPSVKPMDLVTSQKDTIKLLLQNTLMAKGTQDQHMRII